MSKRALVLDLPGADLSAAGDPAITDVIADALSPIDSALPGASIQMGGALETEVGADQVTLTLVDGPGYELIQDHLRHTPTLRRMRDGIRSIHTVIPPATAAAIMAFGTGAHLGITDMAGFFVAYGGGIMNLLATEDGPASTKRQPASTYFERLVAAGVLSAVILPACFAGPGLMGAALWGVRHMPVGSFSDRASAALRELCVGMPVVYLYWSKIDHTGHSSGVGSDAWIGCLEEFDAGLSALLRGPLMGVRTVVTVDHGIVNVEHSALVDVAATPTLCEGVHIVASEARVVRVHAQEGHAANVEMRWRDVLGESVWILSRDQMGTLIGPGDGALIIGDLLALTRGNGGIVDSRTQSAPAITMSGVRGSLTSTEMRIPVIVLSQDDYGTYMKRPLLNGQLFGACSDYDFEPKRILSQLRTNRWVFFEEACAILEPVTP